MGREIAEKKRCLTCVHWKPTSEILGVCMNNSKKLTKSANQVCPNYRSIWDKTNIQNVTI